MTSETTRFMFVLPILFQSIIYIVIYIPFKVFARFKVHGLEELSLQPQGLIFAPNHTSEWDPILVRFALPLFSRKFSPMYYVARQRREYTESGLRQFFYGGVFFKLVGGYPRYSGKKNYNYSLFNHIHLLKRKKNVTIFPEGKKYVGEINRKVHGGVAFLSHVTSTPVIPVAIKGIENFSLIRFFSFKMRISVTFGKPIDPLTIIPQTNPAVEDYQLGAQFIWEKILDLQQQKL